MGLTNQLPMNQFSKSKECFKKLFIMYVKLSVESSTFYPALLYVIKN